MSNIYENHCASLVVPLEHFLSPEKAIAQGQGYTFADEGAAFKTRYLSSISQSNLLSHRGIVWNGEGNVVCYDIVVLVSMLVQTLQQTGH